MAQLVEHAEPELRPLALGQPQAQHLLLAAQIHRQRHVRRCVEHLLALLDLQHQTVQPHHRIDRLQRSLLPGADLLQNAVRHLRNQRVRDLHPEYGAGECRACQNSDQSQQEFCISQTFLN